MITELARVRATSLHSSVTSNLRDGSVTTQPPRFMAMSELNWPVPCISGHALSNTKPGVDARHQLLDAVDGWRAEHHVPPGSQDIEQVVLAPHDALGHTGGAARVEQEEV